MSILDPDYQIRVLSPDLFVTVCRDNITGLGTYEGSLTHELAIRYPSLQDVFFRIIIEHLNLMEHLRKHKMSMPVSQ